MSSSLLLREAEAEMRRSFDPSADERPHKKQKVDGEEGSDRKDDDFVEVGRYDYDTADLQRAFGIQGGSLI
jgi:hypothetical protein